MHHELEEHGLIQLKFGDDFENYAHAAQHGESRNTPGLSPMNQSAMFASTLFGLATF
jgi:hypothetical protein